LKGLLAVAVPFVLKVAIGMAALTEAKPEAVMRGVEVWGRADPDAPAGLAADREYAAGRLDLFADSDGFFAIG